MSVKFPASFIQVAKRLVHYRQGNVEKLVYNKLGVEPSIIDDYFATIDKEQFRKILQLIYTFHQDQPEDPSLIFKSMPLSTFGTIGLAFIFAPTVHSLLQVLERYFHKIMPIFTIETQVVGDTCTVTIHRLESFDDLNPLLCELILWAALDTLATVNISDEEYEAYRGKLVLDIPHEKPVFPSPWTEAPVTYNYGTENMVVTFPAFILDRELITSNPAAMNLLEKDLQRQDLQSMKSQTVTDKVSSYLKNALVLQANPDLKQVAEHLSMSERTLSRRLNEEGENYKSILNTLRMEQAAEMLASSDSYIREIAYKLGFSNEANFSRSFKSHFGVSPTQYRNTKQ